MEEMYKGYRIRIEPDEDAESPREWDNLGTMMCFHRRYELGDKNLGYKSSDYKGWDELLAGIVMRYRKDEGGVEAVLPLYLMDHSGLSLNTTTTGFAMCDPQGWDWGQVGWIFVGRKKVLREFGWRRVSKKRREKVMEVLRAEVKAYDRYLSGDVWGFIVEKDEDHVDSCWGFYGQEEALEEARGVVDWETETRK